MLPVVWLLGTSGVGKSTTGYRMLSELHTAGVKAAFVDADQLRLASGIAAVETELIASALPALSRGYQTHGAQVLIVAGLAADLDHLSRLLPGVPSDRLLTVHLDADGDTIRERVHRRGWLVDLADDAVVYATQIDSDLADLHVDTTGRTPSDLAAQVAEAALAHVERTVSEGSDVLAADDEALSCSLVREASACPQRAIRPSLTSRTPVSRWATSMPTSSGSLEPIPAAMSSRRCEPTMPERSRAAWLVAARKPS